MSVRNILRRLGAGHLKDRAVDMRLWLLGKAGRTQPVPVRMHGLSILIRPDSPDMAVAHSSLGDEFQPLATLFPADYDGLIVDAGGYIGTAAIKLARMYPKATVVTIEPSTENYEILVRNVAPFANIVPVNAALVSADQDSVVLRNRGTGQWGFTVVEAPLDCDEPVVLNSVPGVSLETIRAQHGGRDIGLLKLDIEGGEKVLFDAETSGLDDVFAVFAELHDRIVAGCTESFKRFSANRVILTFGGEKFLSVSRR